MTRQNGPRIDDEHQRQGAPVNTTLAPTFFRWLCSVDNAIGATGVALATGVPLCAGDVISNITFVTGGTAAVTPTAGFVALYSAAATPALLAQSADFGATARAANTAYTVPLVTAQTITADGFYYVSISFTAATIPTLRGINTGSAVMAGALGLSMKVLAQTHGAAVGAVAPATIASPTTVATPCWFALS